MPRHRKRYINKLHLEFKVQLRSACYHGFRMASCRPNVRWCFFKFVSVSGRCRFRAGMYSRANNATAKRGSVNGLTRLRNVQRHSIPVSCNADSVVLLIAPASRLVRHFHEFTVKAESQLVNSSSKEFRCLAS